MAAILEKESPTPLVSVRHPKKGSGKTIFGIFAAKLQGIMARYWNSERLIVFAAVVLQKSTMVRLAVDIQRRLSTRLDLWDNGRYSALIDDTESELLGKLATPWTK